MLVAFFVHPSGGSNIFVGSNSTIIAPVGVGGILVVLDPGHQNVPADTIAVVVAVKSIRKSTRLAFPTILKINRRFSCNLKKTIERKEIYQGPIFKIVKIKMELPRRERSAQRDLIFHNGLLRYYRSQMRQDHLWSAVLNRR